MRWLTIYSEEKGVVEMFLFIVNFKFWSVEGNVEKSCKYPARLL